MTHDRTRYQKAVKVGLAYNSQQQWKEAIAAFRVALAENPREAEVYAGLGAACLGLRMYDRALECYKLAARYSQGNIIHLNQVADVQERMGQLRDASRTYLAAGEIFLRLRRLDEAIDNWERAVRLEPDLLGAHQRLAMVFQRQGDIKRAVREYLAIARIWQGQGEPQKALRMCQAALRLDPQNRDVLTAMDLVRYGAQRFPDPEPAEVVPEIMEAAETNTSLTETVRQLASIFEAERQGREEPPAPTTAADAIVAARGQAQNELAEEIFRDEEEDEAANLSKLERDALIGQGMDFEMRGFQEEAIRCYEKAINGGLQLPAAYFTLGMLYLEGGHATAARQALLLAGKDHSYQPACRAALNKLP